MAEERFDPSRFGDAVGAVEQEDVEELGRDVDLSMLGEVTTDPVGTAETAMVEFARTGQGPSFETLEDIRRGASGLSDLPEEKGMSAASRGAYRPVLDPVTGEPTGEEEPILDEQGRMVQPPLPEFFGNFETVPESRRQMEQLLEIQASPDASFLEKWGASMMLAGPPGGMPMTPVKTHRSSGMGAGLSKMDAVKLSAAGLTMFDPQEFAQVLLQKDEEGERVYPQYAIQQAPDGALVVTNTINNAQSVINRPGMSTLDATQALGVMAAFTPAGRMTAAMPSTTGRIAVGMTTAGLTEAGIQQSQEMLGGEFNPGDVALTAAFAPLVDVARPLMGGIQRVGRYIGSYIPENIGAKVGRATGLSSVVPTAKRQALAFAKNAKEYLESHRPAIFMSEDALPEVHTPRLKILLKMAERMLVTGTGGLRKKQALQRAEVLRHLADRFGLDPATNYSARVLDDMNRNAGEALEAAVRGRANAVEGLVDTDIVLRDFRFKVRDIIAKEASYGEMANQGLIDFLNKMRTSVWVGGVPKPGKLPRGFGVMDDWLQRLRMHAGQGNPQTREAITQVADALETDLRRHADEAGEAGASWLKSMDDAARIANDAEKKTIKAVIEAGEVDEQVMRRVFRRGIDEEMELMHTALSKEGQAQAQQMLLRNAMKVGGWRRGPPMEMEVDVNKIVETLEKDSVAHQLRIFFPEKQDQEMLFGLIEYLRRTAAAQKTGEGAGIAAAGGIKNLAKNAGANAVNLLTVGLYGLAARGWQSGPVRDKLLRLYHAGSDQRLKDRVMQDLTGILMGLGRQQIMESTETDPQDNVYISAEAQDTMKDQSDFGMMMQQLRDATGQTEQAEEDAGAALEKMVQEMGQEIQ